jgi:hypothetical protein
LDFASADELRVEPAPRRPVNIEVQTQDGVMLEEIPLLADDEAVRAIQTLAERGYAPEDVRRAMVELQGVPTTRVRERQAARASLDMRVRNEVGRILGSRGLNPRGRELDRQRLGRENFVVVKAAIDRRINESVGRAAGERSEFTRPQLDQIEENFDTLVQEGIQGVFDA